MLVRMVYLVIVFAYKKTGTIRRAEVNQADRETIRAINGVRNRGEDIGWHTAMYRSAEIIYTISKNMYRSDKTVCASIIAMYQSPEIIYTINSIAMY